MFNSVIMSLLSHFDFLSCCVNSDLFSIPVTPVKDVTTALNIYPK